MASTSNASKALERCKGWCFTLNNPKASDLKDLNPDDLEYLVYGRETAPGTGTEHLQGFVVFKDRKRLTQAKALISQRAHVEALRGTAKQASDYCKKGDQSHDEWKSLGVAGPNFGLNAVVVEEGELPVLGKGAAGSIASLAKWERTKQLAKLGDFESIDPAHYVSNYRALQAIASDNAPRAVDLPDVCGLWYVGPPGSGKSHAARALDSDYYIKPINKWFDGFNPLKHKTIILEDLDTTHASYMGYFLKIWGDKWSFAAEKKGSTIQVRPERVVVTSNYTIPELFGSDPELVKAISRRFKVTTFLPSSHPFSPMRLANSPTTNDSAQPFVPPPLTRQNAVILTHDSFPWNASDNEGEPVEVHEPMSLDTV